MPTTGRQADMEWGSSNTPRTGSLVGGTPLACRRRQGNLLLAGMAKPRRGPQQKPVRILRRDSSGCTLHPLGVTLASAVADERARQKDHISMVTVLG